MATIIDATGCVLGRMASQVAKQLLNGEEVHVVCSEAAVISGTSHKTIKDRYMERYHLGTYRKGPFVSRMPHDIVKRTVRGMIPYQTPRGREAFKRLRCHIGVPAELKGKDATVLEGARRRPHATTMTVGELARQLGANFTLTEGA